MGVTARQVIIARVSFGLSGGVDFLSEDWTLCRWFMYSFDDGSKLLVLVLLFP